MSRFNVRKFFMADGVVVGGYTDAANSDKKSPPPFAITKGSQPEMIIRHVLANPKSTTAELAANFVRKNGEKGLKVTSFESTLSKIVSFLRKKNKFDGTKFKDSLPTDYNQGGQGARRRREELAGDSLDSLLGMDEGADDEASDESEE